MRRLHDEKRFTWDELAKATNVDRSNLLHWLSGQRTAPSPRVSSVVRVSSGLEKVTRETYLPIVFRNKDSPVEIASDYGEEYMMKMLDSGDCEDLYVAVLEYIGRVIHSKRIERGWTWRDFYRRGGVKDHWVKKVELGETDTTLKTLDRICDAVDLEALSLVRAVDIFTEDNIPTLVRFLAQGNSMLEFVPDDMGREVVYAVMQALKPFADRYNLYRDLYARQ